MKLSSWFGKKSNNNTTPVDKDVTEVNSVTTSKLDTKSVREALFSALKSIETSHFPNGVFGQISINCQFDDTLFSESDNHESTSVRELPIVVTLPIKVERYQQELSDALNAAVCSKLGINLRFTFDYKATQGSANHPKQAQLVIAIASGKGGVGKSTVSSNLAVTLALQGYKVGLLDADIYGPSMPMMFGLQGQNVVTHDEKTMEPFHQFGVYLNSIGFLIPEDKATIWRGPMASRALMQVINETNWPELDVLLVDMPPGTGDIQLTMSETVKCDGALIVTTPQNVALADAEKGIQMFSKVNTPVLGLVENMSQFVCQNCGTEHQIFGAGGGKDCASRHHVPLLAQLPLVPEVRESGDNGRPWSLIDTNNQYEKLANSLIMQLSKSTPETIAIT